MRRVVHAPLLLFRMLLICILLLLPNHHHPLAVSVNDDQVLGLIVFKSSLQDPTSALTSWTADDDTPCSSSSWAHLQCNPSSGLVIRLFLDDLSLSGRGLPRGLDHLPALESLSLSGNHLSGDLHLSSLLPRLNSLDLSHNTLSGRIPDDLLTSLPSLRSLDFSANSFSGPIPDTLFSTTNSVRYLDLSRNRLEGPLPSTLLQSPFLRHLNLSGNSLSGSPAAAGGLSRLRVLDLSHNSFSGPIPDTIFTNLHNLKILYLHGNGFSGTIPGLAFSTHLNRLDLSYNLLEGSLPISITTSLQSSLSFLRLSNNKLSGDLPAWISNLTILEHLDLSQNQLTGSIPASLSLNQLNYLSLSDNEVSGEIPATLSIGCSQLKEIRLKGNLFNGSIPPDLLDLGLQVLDLSSNNFTGTMPPGSSKLAETLESLDLSNNQLTGGIPPELALYFNLRYLNLSWNHLWSRLPPELGYFRNLSVLDLRRSMLYGQIPGDLCDSGGSLAVVQLDGNSLTGQIPDEIGNCTSLYLLSLSHNALNGSIPISISRMKKLKILNLELNDLSGEIPQQLGSLDNLLAVNISHNRLNGRLPVGGIFPSLDQSSLQGNLGLCTPLVTEPCKMNVPKPLVLDPNAYGFGSNNDDDDNSAAANVPSVTSLRHRKFLSVSAMVAISAALVIFLGVLVVSLLNISVRRRIGLIENALESMCSSSTKSAAGPGSAAAAVGKIVLFGPRSKLIRSEDLVVGAESLLNKATEIGRGVFGTVYRASIGEGRILAIKKLLLTSNSNINLNHAQYHDDFDRDVRILGKARHPNLMPLKGYYWTPQLQLLISEYAPMGSLNARLHHDQDRSKSSSESSSMMPAVVPPPPHHHLSWANRFKIVSGTANGLAYLHQSFRPPIVHYNVKPSNILLDENCNPMITDFGLAKLVPAKIDRHTISSRFQSAVGYMAPELACQSLRINEKCDVYGFGIVVLELVTGRKPVEYGEDDVVILIDQVRVLLEQGNVLDCVDPAMGEFPEEEVLPVLKLGLVCASQIPSSRPSMAEVVQILQVIKTPVLERMQAAAF